jgi:hypothetical protein
MILVCVGALSFEELDSNVLESKIWVSTLNPLLKQRKIQKRSGCTTAIWV